MNSTSAWLNAQPEPHAVLAAWLAIDQERRDRERAQEQEEDEFQEEYQREAAPLVHALGYKRMTKLFAQPDLASQMQACQIADSLLQAPPYNIKPSGHPHQGQSR